MRAAQNCSSVTVYQYYARKNISMRIGVIWRGHAAKYAQLCLIARLAAVIRKCGRVATISKVSGGKSPKCRRAPREALKYPITPLYVEGQ